MVKLTTRFDLWRNGIRVYVDGKEINLFDLDTAEKANAGFYDDKEIKIYHESYKNKKRSCFLTPTLNTTKHPKGIIKKCQYYMISFGLWDSPARTTALPLQRLLYIWFYDDLDPELDIGHLNGNSLDNRPSNLKQMTRKENLAMRNGAVNQYGLRKRDRKNESNIIPENQN